MSVETKKVFWYYFWVFLFNFKLSHHCFPFILISHFGTIFFRGLMIDTARHYLTVATILKTIDALSYNKVSLCLELF